MHVNFACLSVLFVNAIHIRLPGWLICVLRWTTYQNVQCVQNGKKHYLCLWATGVCMSGRAILDLKISISQKLIPRAGTVDKWVPADGGKHAPRVWSCWLSFQSLSSLIVQLGKFCSMCCKLIGQVEADNIIDKAQFFLHCPSSLRRLFPCKM